MTCGVKCVGGKIDAWEGEVGLLSREDGQCNEPTGFWSEVGEWMLGECGDEEVETEECGVD